MTRSPCPRHNFHTPNIPLQVLQQATHLATTAVGWGYAPPPPPGTHPQQLQGNLQQPTIAHSVAARAASPSGNGNPPVNGLDRTSMPAFSSFQQGRSAFPNLAQILDGQDAEAGMREQAGNALHATQRLLPQQDAGNGSVPRTAGEQCLMRRDPVDDFMFLRRRSSVLCIASKSLLALLLSLVLTWYTAGHLCKSL